MRTLLLRVGGALAAALSLSGAMATRGSYGVQERDYLVFVASEATDQISLIRFGADGGRIVREHITGVNRADPDGPHGLAVSPNGRHYFVTTAHGTPYGYLWKYTTYGDTLLGRTELGNFPASMQVSPDGHYAWVVNFNLHGEMVPSSVSVVATGQMLEMARIRTCAMPHGSRLSPDGSRHYSVCMMDDVLVEIDARAFEVRRHFILRKGGEHAMTGSPSPSHGADAGAHAGHGMQPSAPGNTRCSPTWVAPSPDGRRLYVACNATNDIVEVDAERLALLRRIPAGNGVYNLAVTGNGELLVATNKRDQSVSVIRVATGEEVGRVRTIRPVVHGVAISDDDRYAFISVEGYGAEPGTVEMLDLREIRRVAHVDVGQMAGGIDFWKSEPREEVRFE